MTNTEKSQGRQGFNISGKRKEKLALKEEVKLLQTPQKTVSKLTTDSMLKNSFEFHVFLKTLRLLYFHFRDEIISIVLIRHCKNFYHENQVTD